MKDRDVGIIVWEEDGAWLGYHLDYPEYWTQGETLNALKDHLRDLLDDIANGVIPGISKK